jgi:hypothetical protein
MNMMVEEWGGKYQSHDISAKEGTNIDLLLEKILLEAEILDLKANAAKKALGVVLEASLEKGRGYVTKILVQTGTLHNGDPILSGEYAGKVKAMFNERGKKIKEAGPSTPVLVLGLNGAPQAGETFKVTKDDSEAKSLAAKRGQINREQANRARKRISLDEIGRRLALGTFKELNLIVKGDFDGSVEALSDSLIKLSVESIQVNGKRLREALNKKGVKFVIGFFDEDIHLSTDIKSNEAHYHFVLSKLHEVLNSERKEKKSSLAKTIHQIAETAHRRSLVILFTDMFDNMSEFDKVLSALQHLKHNKHEVVLFHVLDKSQEIELDFENRPYIFIDKETNEQIKLNPTQVQEQYKTKASDFSQEVQNKCLSYKINYVDSDINDGYNAILLQYLIKRSKMLR